MSELVMLPVSPLNAAGLLTAAGWDCLRSAGRVAVGSIAADSWEAHLREAGVEAHLLDARSAAALIDGLAGLLTGEGEADGSATDDPLVLLIDSEHPFLPGPTALLDALEARLGRRLDADVRFASPTAPGSAVVESVRIMHALRSPGGDVWSAEQTHQSLARYLLEETFEVLDELEGPDPDGPTAVEEFGDLLFQLVFHARIGMESASPWTLDDVARSLNRKMYRRNPHVFAPEDERTEVGTVQDVVDQWQAVKSAEKPRSHLGEGIPSALPALQAAFKLIQRARTGGELPGILEHLEQVRIAAESAAPTDPEAAITLDALDLLAVVVRAEEHDRDPESALRRLNRLIDSVGTARSVSPDHLA
ncbi:hypothetical protein M3A96_11455 [Helcobacillus massiliensis]|uniref:XTP/dITP diphosphohydrolase n=1 Tax=Helcobacillus massiliensis TaxID=521392 RepID=A0A839QUT1_9MICO|nr:MazG nucleotide pyrophosphohydrolase domain-containing protein [Helcobacillus massiliensis]MBB3022609.1 XTP/dITP diphosphohydrolase [Helcobacillus massiliensis]MCT1558725.1 hypothetical protein [Helcobacillus massiliensis]MCT2037444.1 hypothetical protein [Helcobacillus massiliensis]MCT2332964.1 hypothetical protein [Helcobacillus massiliensis]MDK7743109.1 MazG nucleotide pyrophosphohydrolase domain-containing protein [Helcobacillus massiliensis]